MDYVLAADVAELERSPVVNEKDVKGKAAVGL
jgi:hypothetical protein